MREVSCRMFGFFEIAAERLGFDLERLIEGSGVSRRELTDPANRVDWDQWVTICDRFETLCGGPEEAERWGRIALETPVARRVRYLTGHFVSALQVYDAVARWFGPLLFRSLDFETRRLPGGAIWMRIAIQPEYRECAAWFRLAKGSLVACPSYLGLPDAEVTAEITPRWAEYHITPPDPLPLWPSLKRLARSMLTSDAALEELSTLQREVSASHHAVLRSERDFRRALDQLPDAVAIVARGRILFANAAWSRHLSYGEPRSLVGRLLSDFVADSDWRKLEEHLASREACGPLVACMLPARGEPVAMEIPALSDLAYSGREARLFVARNITDKLRADEALKRSEATTRALLEALPDVILRISRGGQVTAVAAGADWTLPFAPEALVGVDASSILDLVPEADREIIERAFSALRLAFETGEPQSFETQLGYADNTRFVETRMARLDDTEAVAVVRDVTDRRRMEAQLAMADRLASLGTLATGVAHEINNPLTYVLANLAEIIEAAERDPSEGGQRILELAIEAKSGAARMRHIVSDLKTFARIDDSSESGAVDVEATLDAMSNMAFNEIRHRARLARDYGGVPPVRGSESRLAQVFLNLLVNAAQAIPVGAADHNVIRIRTRVDDRGRVLIEIQDTGTGIEDSIRHRIFDPFFSTKPDAMGTGLGLAICHQIVHALGGEITVDSEVGVGTSMRVSLPAADPARATAHSRPPPAPKEVEPARILIIDDDPAVARSLARLLRPHRVTVTRNGAEALELLGRDPDWDVVLCDVMMPVMSGVELYDALREKHPRLLDRLVFVTGGAFTEKARNLLRNVTAPTLEKPFEPREVHAVVNRFL